MKAKTGNTVKEREGFWTQVIEAARAYPEGVKSYCEKNNISQDLYYAWFRKLRGQHPDWLTLTGGRRKKDGRRAERKPKTEVVEKARRRRFSAEYKARILAEIDQAGIGGGAGILRREGVYSSQVKKWRTERDTAGLGAKKRGPKADSTAAELKKVRAENEQLQKRLKQAHQIIDLQKKVSEILGVTLTPIEEEE